MKTLKSLNKFTWVVCRWRTRPCPSEKFARLARGCQCSHQPESTILSKSIKLIKIKRIYVAPARWPKSVTEFGSPPKFTMLVWSHSSAAMMSEGKRKCMLQTTCCYLALLWELTGQRVITRCGNVRRVRQSFQRQKSESWKSEARANVNDIFWSRVSCRWPENACNCIKLNYNDAGAQIEFNYWPGEPPLKSFDPIMTTTGKRFMYRTSGVTMSSVRQSSEPCGSPFTSCKHSAGVLL